MKIVKVQSIEFLWVHFRVLSYQIGRVLTGLPPLPMLIIHTLLKLELVLELTWSVNIQYDLEHVP